ncbi:MAG: HD domain-containing protein [Candidatus Dojkabacteria bacterium]|nr:HD domain-containing protein [Candidatus Dojkabacteria bacterium]
MNDIVKQAQEYVLRECKKKTNPFGMNAYNHHFKSVVMFAGQLATMRNADREIVLVSAWLHDIASIKGAYERHHVIGQKYAEEFLKKHNYPKERIAKVKHCIYAHRGSKDIPRESIEAECVADADAMSHFNTISSLFYLAIIVRGLETEDANTFVKEKLKRSYNKLTSIGKELIQDKYDAAMKLL